MNVEFVRACEQLTAWCNASAGTPIEISAHEPLAFIQHCVHSINEISLIEKRYRIKFSADYVFFLRTVGASELFVNRYKLGFTFPRVTELSYFSASVFENAGQDPFPRLVLVTALAGRGDVGGFNASLPDGNNFSVFSHEDDPDTWLHSVRRQISFSAWIVKLVASKGEDDLP